MKVTKLEKRKLFLEDVEISGRNFDGRKFGNTPGAQRSFCVKIKDPDMAEMLKQEGWAVQIPKNHDPSQEPTWILPVTARFDNFPPKITMVTSCKHQILTQDTVACLQNASFSDVKMIISPSITQDGHIKAYLREMGVVIAESPLDRWLSEMEAPEEMPGTEAVSDDMPF